MKINIYPYKEKFIINALENLSGPEMTIYLSEVV